MLQKWSKFVGDALRYCLLKVLDHSKSWEEAHHTHERRPTIPHSSRPITWRPITPHDRRLTIKSMILSGSTPSTGNISMRHRRICFIFASLDSTHQALQFGLFGYLSYCCIDVCAWGIQLHGPNWELVVELWKFEPRHSVLILILESYEFFVKKFSGVPCYIYNITTC